jgi:hypothetical protein
LSGEGTPSDAILLKSYSILVMDVAAGPLAAIHGALILLISSSTGVTGVSRPTYSVTEISINHYEYVTKERGER